MSRRDRRRRSDGGDAVRRAPSEEKSTAKRFVGAPESKTYKSDLDRYMKFGAQSDDLIEHKADLAEGANATGGYLVPADYNDASSSGRTTRKREVR